MREYKFSALPEIANLSPRALELQKQSLGHAPERERRALCCSIVPFCEGLGSGLSFDAPFTFLAQQMNDAEFNASPLSRRPTLTFSVILWNFAALSRPSSLSPYLALGVRRTLSELTDILPPHLNYVSRDGRMCVVSLELRDSEAKQGCGLVANSRSAATAAVLDHDINLQNHILSE